MTEPLNLDWVTQQLAVGGRFPMSAVPLLGRELGIRRIVDCRGEDRDDEAALASEGIALLHLATVDREPLSPDDLERGVAWVNDGLWRGEKVFVHCEHGIGRSALLVLCVLVSRGLEPLQALSLLKQARWQVSPSPEQLEAFRGWTRLQLRTRGASWSVPPFVQLAQIAYSHLRSERATP